MLNASITWLFHLSLCSYTKSYSAKNFCHRICRNNNFFCVIKKMSSILFVFTVNFSPNKYIHHTPRKWTTIVIFFSCVEYLCFASFSFWLSNATECPSYTSTSLIALSKASICTLNGLSKLDSFNTGIDITSIFSLLNARWHLLYHFCL